MLAKTKGIVFRAVKYRETSLIVDIFTVDLGFRTFIINGVRKPKARFHANLFQIGSILEMEIYFQNNKEINRIKEVRPYYLYKTIPFDIIKSGILIFCIEVLTKSIKESDENENLFDYLVSYFINLDKTKSVVSNYPLWFMIHLSAYIGFRPGLNQHNIYFDMKEGHFSKELPSHANIISPPHSTYLLQLLQLPLRDIDSMSLSGSERKNLLDRMIDYYRLHVENFKIPKSLDILAEVFRG